MDSRHESNHAPRNDWTVQSFRYPTKCGSCTRLSSTCSLLVKTSLSLDPEQDAGKQQSMKQGDKGQPNAQIFARQRRLSTSASRSIAGALWTISGEAKQVEKVKSSCKRTVCCEEESYAHERRVLFSMESMKTAFLKNAYESRNQFLEHM